MLRRLALALTFSLICLAGTAHAAFPGANGLVVYTNDNDDTGLRQLALVNPISLAGGPFVPDTNFASYEAEWSPDGQRLIMLRHNQTSGAYDIWVANADGSGLRQVTSGGSETDPSWAPDGHHIVYVGSDALYTINVDDPLDTPHRIPGTDTTFFTPTWSPDGGLIAVEHYNSVANLDQIAVMAPDGSGFKAIATAPDSSLTLQQPAWSPDGSRVYYAQGAFILGCEANPPFQIYSVPRDGGAPVSFSHDPSVSEYGPAPSPDGKQMAFARCDDPANDNDHIYVANLDGTSAHALSSGDHYDNEANWQPTAPQFASSPTISGSATNNQTLTASVGSTEGAVSSSLQFERCNAQGAACVPIPGAVVSVVHVLVSSLSYRLTSADIGFTIRAHEVDTNAIGSTSSDSAPTSAVAPSSARCSNVFAGTAKADRIRGSSGSDRISGGRGRDKLFGLAGSDCISGGAGNDVISGGKGNDRLSGGAGNDHITAGPGRNKVSGGSGNDVINVRNHRRDIVNCGKGRKDRVVADRVDKLRGCERVRRRR